MFCDRNSLGSGFSFRVLWPWLRQGWWGTLFFWLMLILPAQAALELRVAIEEDVSQLTVGSSTAASVRDTAGNVVGNLPEMGAFAARSEGSAIRLEQWSGAQLWIEPSQGGYVYIGDRWYRGRTLLVRTAAGLTAVNYVDLDQYLYSVLGGEMSGSWPQEALKAQAVAARSYALYRRQTGATTIYDVGDTTTWQVYDGLEDESAGTIAAVNATAGQVLTYNGQIIEAVFHSSSGGHTENVENVWSQPLPYLRGVPDFDQGSPAYEWNKVISASEMSNLIAGVGTVLSFRVENTTPSGRAMTVRVVGDVGEKVLTGNELRRALGLRSTLLTNISPQIGQVASAASSLPAPASFQINGRGFGHGLGMSQWGAHNMAQTGYTYNQILQHYYSNTALSQIQVQ